MTETDGVRGWCVVTAAFCTHTITFGIVYSFGILFNSLEENFNGTKTDIALIPSLTTGFLHSAGLLASVLVNKCGCRMVTIIGAMACSTGYVLSIFAPNIYVLYVTMGIVSGCGFGMVFMPSVLIVTQYFNKFRSVACGIALSGCGIGAFIFSPLTKVLLDEYSLRGTLLLLSAIILNCIPCALLFRPLTTRRVKTTKKNKENEEESRDLLTNAGETVPPNEKFDPVCDERTVIRCKKCLTSNKNADETNKIRDCEMQLRHDVSEPEKKNDLQVVICMERYGGNNTSQEKYKYMTTVARYKAILKRPKMFIVFLSQFLFIFGFYLPFIFIPDKAKGLGINEKSSAWVISAIGISSIMGRIVLGCIADKPSMDRLVMFKIFLLIGGISTSFIPLLNNIWLMVIYAIVYGISTGFTISITSVILADLVGFEYLADSLGIVSLFSGIGSVLGPPVAGVLYDNTGSYTAPFLTSGASQIFSAILLFMTSLFH